MTLQLLIRYESRKYLRPFSAFHIKRHLPFNKNKSVFNNKTLTATISFRYFILFNCTARGCSSSSSKMDTTLTPFIYYKWWPSKCILLLRQWLKKKKPISQEGLLRLLTRRRGLWWCVLQPKSQLQLHFGGRCLNVHWSAR